MNVQVDNMITNFVVQEDWMVNMAYTFYNRTVITWNNLPGSVVNARTINGFKNRLDTHWINHSLKYNHKSSTTTDDI